MQQLFLFIVAMVVIAATVYVGVRLIGSMVISGCENAKGKLLGDISVALDENSVAGSRNVVSIMPSCDAKTLCFVDAGKITESAELSTAPISIKTSVKNGVNMNIFLNDTNGMQAMGFDGRIAIGGDGWICVEQKNGKFSVETKGYTRTVLLSIPLAS